MPVKTTIPAGAAHDDRPIENFQTGQVVALWLFLRFKDIPILTDTGQCSSVLGTWREMRHVLRPLSAILFLRGFMHASITAFLPTYINQQTGNLWLAGIGLTVFEAAGVVGVLTAGSLSDTFGHRRILLLSLIGAPASLFLFTAISGWFGLAALVLVGFTLLSTHPGHAGHGSGACQKQPIGRQRFFHDDLIYCPVGRGRGGRVRRRSDWLEVDLFSLRLVGGGGGSLRSKTTPRSNREPFRETMSNREEIADDAAKTSMPPWHKRIPRR